MTIREAIGQQRDGKAATKKQMVAFIRRRITRGA